MQFDFNSSAHKLPFLRRARPSLRGVFCWLFFVFLVFLFGFVLFCVLAGLFSWWTPQIGHVGLCTGPRSLLTPQCGNIQDFAQFVQWHKHCVTTWREPRRRRTEKKSGCNLFLLMCFNQWGGDPMAVGMALVLPALTDCRWWFDPPKGNGRRQKKVL